MSRSFEIAIDRTKATQAGFSERDVANVARSIRLSGSFQITPMFFLRTIRTAPATTHRPAQTPQYTDPVLAGPAEHPDPPPPAQRSKTPSSPTSPSIHRASEMEVINHYNIQPHPRHLRQRPGPRSWRRRPRHRKNRIVARQHLRAPARQLHLVIRGQLETMRTSYTGLLTGLVFSVILVYLLIVVNFQSWLDPFIIITALPAASSPAS